ncbi:hypothetical protein OQH60_07195 [Campylobacter sp. MIT 21-1685]|uniref:hypothetical protein n=1 Tax=unclassified Campylobacter TaxID=2593542 RepID=UPI00224A87E3|nr:MULTISPECIES: hypothetical protein [unclassified Campylobacter]MCX2683669.1 hypothetical protein [Campylobacter sp. MIT 21-1684]MCX2751929.1 hypothetical protein [Campylobacter sp. MIT 21-1682]MCX2808130.1 hypothetical protein [Campylobacter sp. MIT 21-1685]
MDSKILHFITKQKLLSWAMKDEEGVYSASAFYVFDADSLAFIIASDKDTKHIHLAYKNPNVAITIAKEDSIALLKGIQAKALFKEATAQQTKQYFQQFPFAKLSSKATIYALEIFWVKFTDNTLLLEKKLEFSRSK